MTAMRREADAARRRPACAAQDGRMRAQADRHSALRLDRADRRLAAGGAVRPCLAAIRSTAPISRSTPPARICAPISSPCSTRTSTPRHGACWCGATSPPSSRLRRVDPDAHAAFKLAGGRSRRRKGAGSRCRCRKPTQSRRESRQDRAQTGSEGEAGAEGRKVRPRSTKPSKAKPKSKRSRSSKP